jgi:hypothetical protein
MLIIPCKMKWMLRGLLRTTRPGGRPKSAFIFATS